MTDNFERALGLVLGHEGGLSDHALDRGGRTNLGITQATYNTFRRGRGLSQRKVDFITADEVRAIYREMYWDEVRADELPWPLAYATFDAAVNSGPDRAARWLQQSLGVDVDGKIGPKTLAAARAKGASALIPLMKARSDFLADLVKRAPSQAAFLKGWLRRLFDVTKGALA